MLSFDPNGIFSEEAMLEQRDQWEADLSPVMNRNVNNYLDSLNEQGMEYTDPGAVPRGAVMQSYHDLVAGPMRNDVIDAGEQKADAVYYSMLEDELANDGMNAMLGVVAAAGAVSVTSGEKKQLLDLVFTGARAAPTSADSIYRWMRRIRNVQLVGGLAASATIVASPFLAGIGVASAGGAGTAVGAPASGSATAGSIARAGANVAKERVRQEVHELTHDPRHLVGRGKQVKEWADKIESKSTEVSTSVHSQETRRQMESRDDVRYKKWVSRSDERVRHTHVEAHGQIVPMQSNFQIGGYELREPGDTRAPMQEWMNCRCVMVAVQNK